MPEGDKRRHGYSRDKRPDCPQVVIALVVTPEGLPLANQVLPGNTADCTTLRMFLARIEQQYGRARRVWVMDRGVPTEAVLAEMRNSDPPVQDPVGTPKGRLSRLEKDLLAEPWQQTREGVRTPHASLRRHDARRSRTIAVESNETRAVAATLKEGQLKAGGQLVMPCVSQEMLSQLRRLMPQPPGSSGASPTGATTAGVQVPVAVWDTLKPTDLVLAADLERTVSRTAGTKPPS